MCPRNAIAYNILSCIVSLILVGGCSKSPKNFASMVDPAAAGKAAIEQYDTDYNSRIEGKELEAAGSLKSNLEKIDLNGDKAITADEIADRVSYWQSSKQLWSRTPIRCMVFHNKELLADAEVKLVPEKFLGDKLKAAKGKTSFNGVAILHAENHDSGDPLGVGPGFYKVEITKAGEAIPAKYNTNTILGIDTSMDNPAMYNGVRFVLEYEQPKKK
jgi:hypothetical protein